MQDIFRKYPNRYESIIGTLCENLDTLDEPEAKVGARRARALSPGGGRGPRLTATRACPQASMIWIIGQYADRIDNAHELMAQFAENFLEEPVDVQLALLTATVKLFLMRPAEAEHLIKKVGDGPWGAVPASGRSPRPRAASHALCCAGLQVGDRERGKPRPARPRLHLLAPPVGGSAGCQGERAARPRRPPP